MLTLSFGDNRRDCEGHSRRDFLRAGALALGGWSLASLLAARAQAATNYVRDKSVVLVFLGGGASHIESFNPNMTAPAPYRSVTGEVSTSLPGVTFGGTFPGLARHAHRMAVVRSFAHSVGSHGEAIAHVLSGGTDPQGKRNEGFSLGAMCARIGAGRQASKLPPYALVTAPETDNQYRTEKRRVTRGSTPGVLGPAYSPFDPTDEDSLRNLELAISPERLDDRRMLLRALDRVDRQFDASGQMASLDRFEQQAVDLVLGGAKEALDLSQEDPRLVEWYDTGHYQVGNKARRPQLVRRSTIGRQMLLARRLCEAGCGFVTVQSAGWDMHADGNNPGIVDGMQMLGPPLDRALSVFLDDIEQRGLSDKILLVVTGDFGRTPKINRRGGRDHWSRLCTLMLAGGGLNMGQVIGRSARNNDEPATEPITPQHLLATVTHMLFDVGQMRLDSSLPREIARHVERSEPIRELFCDRMTIGWLRSI